MVLESTSPIVVAKRETRVSSSGIILSDISYFTALFAQHVYTSIDRERRAEFLTSRLVRFVASEVSKCSVSLPSRLSAPGNNAFQSALRLNHTMRIRLVLRYYYDLIVVWRHVDYSLNNL